MRNIGANQAQSSQEPKPGFFLGQCIRRRKGNPASVFADFGLNPAVSG
jgi:hypothetical protein